MTEDWVRWHEQYGDRDAPLNARLAVVRSRLAEALEQLARPASVLSLCAGDGRDVVPVVAEAAGRGVHHRATLVELSHELAERARVSARDAGVDADVICADAGDVATTAGRAPADVVLLCGIFGNIGDDDVRHVIEHAGALVRPGGTVIWTRHRRAPDLTPSIRSWFTAAGFDEVGFDSGGAASWSVGVHRNVSARSDPPRDRWFTFVR